MGRYIHGERDGIHIIDLLQTEELLEQAREFVREVARRGGSVLFVGTKKQAQDSIRKWADRSGMPYVNQRWLGGLLTNHATISQRIERLHTLGSLASEGQLDLLPTKERMSMQAELRKLEHNLGGVRDMKHLPDAVFIADLKTEEIALREAVRLRIPIIGLVDTNCDPNPVTYVVPGNDDAIRSCELVIGTIGEAVTEASTAWREQEERRREEERLKREAEERAKREAEERAKQQAEEAAKREAEEVAKREAGEAGQAAAPQAPTRAPQRPARAAEGKPQGEAPAPQAPPEAATKADGGS
jgi:small subunit ribosomal protein S2